MIAYKPDRLLIDLSGLLFLVILIFRQECRSLIYEDPINLIKISFVPYF